MSRRERLDLIMDLTYASSGPSVDPASDVLLIGHLLEAGSESIVMVLQDKRGGVGGGSGVGVRRWTKSGVQSRSVQKPHI